MKTHKKRLDTIQGEDVKKRFKTVDENNMKIQANKSMMSEYFAKGLLLKSLFPFNFFKNRKKR